MDTKTQPRTLYLLRHGATEANLRRPYTLQGQRIDLPLCETGRRQAAAASRVLADRPIEFFFSSPLRRAMQTAEILAAPHGKTVVAVPELIECDVGRWEGLSWDAARDQDPDCWQAFQADPGMSPYAGGESFFAVQCRVVPAIDRLIRDHRDADIVIVTHNIVARVYLAHLLGLPIANARGIRQDNGGITLVSLGDDSPQVVTVNSVFHLEGIVAD